MRHGWPALLSTESALPTPHGRRRRTAIAQACSRRRTRRLSCRPVRAV